MKKGLTMLVAAMIILGLVCVISTVAAVDKSIGSSLKLTGTGVIDVGLDVNTDDSYSGLALSQSLYTPGLGMHGPSYMEYRSDFELEMYNVTEANRSQNLVYAEDGTSTNAKRSFNLANYDVGSVMGFRSNGDTTHQVEAYGDGFLSEMQIGGEIEGKMRLSSKVVDPDTKAVQSIEINEFVGNYTYAWSSYAELVDYPAGEKDINWLGCP